MILYAMKRFDRGERQAYRLSNEVFTIDFPMTEEMQVLAGMMASGLGRGDRSLVHAASQELLDRLCEATQLPPTHVRIKETAYARFARSRNGRRRAILKLYGTCDDRGTITVAFRTAVRQKVFSYRQFLNTLIHEFGHHWDYHSLRLTRSFHTRGFYSRLDTLLRRLLGEVHP